MIQSIGTVTLSVRIVLSNLTDILASFYIEKTTINHFNGRIFPPFCPDSYQEEVGGLDFPIYSR